MLLSLTILIFKLGNMKATIFLTYWDDSEVCFTFECDEDLTHALATLLMVCRGTLMASSAQKIVAYDEDGFDLCSYQK